MENSEIRQLLYVIFTENRFNGNTAYSMCLAVCSF